MKHKENTNNASAGAPVLDFISGKTNTVAARRLTRNIGSVQTLWQLAKMAGIVKKCDKE